VTLAVLQRVTIERLPNDHWKLVRERAESGETFVCSSLREAFATVLAAYDSHGRPVPLDAIHPEAFAEVNE
jgi:hypothetical protein